MSLQYKAARMNEELKLRKGRAGYPRPRSLVLNGLDRANLKVVLLENIHRPSKHFEITQHALHDDAFRWSE